jgi:hypothetical protein
MAIFFRKHTYICSVITLRHQDTRGKRIASPLTFCHFNSLQDGLTPEINSYLQKQCTIFIFMMTFYHLVQYAELEIYKINCP